MLSKSMLHLSSVLSSSANVQHNKHASFSSLKKESLGCSLVSSSVVTFVRFTVAVLRMCEQTLSFGSTKFSACLCSWPLLFSFGIRHTQCYSLASYD